jgi:hypothetical protein
VRPPEKNVRALRNLGGFCQAVAAPAGDDSKSGEVAKTDDSEAVLLVRVATL